MKLFFFVLVFLFVSLSWAQKKIELDDLSIKGELLNDDRLRILAREKSSLKNYVKFRVNYRKEIMEGIPKPEARLKY